MSSPATQAATETKYKKPSVIINIGSGSATDVSEEMMQVFEQKGYPAPKIYVVEPEGLEESFNKVNSDGTDLLIVYGGDGTCNFGAKIAAKADIPLIALPGGTMNMLPKALYATDDWKEALELALSQPQDRWQAAGKANGKVFFCGAILGDPIVMSEAREELREGGIVEAVKQIPDIVAAITHGEEFEFLVDGEVFDRAANTLHLSCPFMSLGATESDRFELASAPQLTMTQLLGIGAVALVNDWRSSPGVLVTKAEEVTVLGEGAFDILLDGEPEQVTCPIEISLELKGVRVLAPKAQQKADA